MFGKIIDILENLITIENLKQVAESSILNYHAIFEESDRKLVGEIIGINEKEIKIMLVGEIINDLFSVGVTRKPSYNTVARLVYKSEVELILGNQDVTNKNNLLIGKSNTYDGYNVMAKKNEFLANHFAIIGNTGSGKSCGVARLLQNIFYYSKESTAINAHIILFDVYGEYNRAFTNLDRVPNINYKKFTTEFEFQADELVQIPAYFLDIDDIALLLEANDKAQLPIIEQALKLVYIFTSQDPNISKYKNDIIAKSLLDILSSGKNPTQIRDQIVAVLTTYNTETLNLETTISQPGYNRTLRQCLNIDNQGKMSAVQFVVDFLDQFTKVDLDKIKTGPETIYSLEDLYHAFEFALISEGVLSSEVVYEKTSVLKTRLHSIINSEKNNYFDVKEPISKSDYIEKLFQTKEEYPAQVVNMNFSHLDERFAKTLTKIFAKLFFNYATRLNKRASYPIHMILEEAHRYTQIDNDLEILGYNIFDRITKEGRKYGVVLGFVTQRPSELTSTSLSQCSNFLVFRMFYPEDLKIIGSISSNISNETLEKLKTLQPGMAIAFGTAFQLPQIIKLELPEPMPESTSMDISDIWYKVEEEDI